MKRNVVAVIFSITLIAAAAIRGQAPDANDDQKLLALVKEVQAQEAQIADNQAKIDAKLSEIAETLRVARIFTSREK
jgi:hypothetical protein